MQSHGPVGDSHLHLTGNDIVRSNAVWRLIYREIYLSLILAPCFARLQYLAEIHRGYRILETQSVVLLNSTREFFH
jgi:hypothetical protein